MKFSNKNLSKYYGRPMTVKRPWWAMLTNQFIKDFSREEVTASFNYQGTNCLDIACGDGELINRYLNKRYKRLIGVDTSRKEIIKARNAASANTSYLVYSLEAYLDKLISKRASFNDVYLLAVLEHVAWPKEVVAKISKIVKKGGRVVIEVPNVAWLPYRLGLLAGKFPETAPTRGVIPGVYDEHIRFFTMETLDKIFSEAGFKKDRLDCSGRLRKLKLLWPSLLASDFVISYKNR